MTVTGLVITILAIYAVGVTVWLLLELDAKWTKPRLEKDISEPQDTHE